MKAHLPILIALGFVLAPMIHAAESESPAQGAPLRYAATWYHAFAPRTALDMVRQTPGFTLEEGDTRRGLSGAVGNVLVDGQRPSAKEQTLEEILQRIPAAQVEWIEIWRGPQTAGDPSGQAVLVNVVRTTFSGQGVGSVGFEYAHQHRAMPNGWMAWTGRAHAVDYALGASTYSLRRELPGTRELRNGVGQVSGNRRDSSPRDFAEYTVNGESSFDAGGGRMRLTGQGHYERYHEDSTTVTHDLEGARVATEFIPYTQTRRTAELGAHLHRAVGAWNLSSVLLMTRARFGSDMSSTSRDAGGRQTYRYGQVLERDSGETILSSTLVRPLSHGQRLELGIEGAFNSLDAALDATQDTGTGPVNFPVPNSNVRIEEIRTEAFVHHSWQPGERWAIDARLAGEFSRLEFAGRDLIKQTNHVVELAYAKPSLQLSRSIGAANQLRARLSRDVGQLDFTDFVSSLSLAEQRVDGGNPDLQPQTSWDAELAADLRPAADLAVTVSLFHRWVRDTADFVHVGRPGSRVDAPGNLGDGRIQGIHVTARAPLKILRGGSLSIDGLRQESRVTDPLTGKPRGISELERWKLLVGFRQDLPRLTWGLNYTHKARLSSFLLREIERHRPSPSLDAFVEVALGQGLRLRAAALSILDQPELRDRLFYETDRRDPLQHAEIGRRDPGTWYQLSLSGSF